MRSILLVCSALLLTAWTSPAVGDFVPFPPGSLYEPYLAAPGEPRFGLTGLVVSDSDILDSGEQRARLQLGGTFGLFRVADPQDPEQGWQLDFQAGFDGQFDTDHSLDNIGWDGIYGLYLTRTLGPKTAARVGLHHVSSHVGDEFLERTGRGRINYTREELVVGLSRQMTDELRVYGEVGWGYEVRRQDLQEPGRLEVGAELDRKGALWGDFGWYAAVDLGATEEKDWNLDTSVHVGVSFPSSDNRRWRAGIGWYDGRVPIGEFFQNDESFVVIGLWLDL
jgi:hypothetical protein